MADDGEAAWAMLEEQDYDVLLCDINMPRLDGMALLRRTRERSQNPPEVIMLTGQATVESAIEAMKLGAYDYLTKPYRIGELSAFVTAAAEKQQLKVDNQTPAGTDRPDALQLAGDRRRIAADEGSFAVGPARCPIGNIGYDHRRIRRWKGIDRPGDTQSEPPNRKTFY